MAKLCNACNMRDSNTTHSNAPLAGEARQERGAKRRWRSTCHFNMLGLARSHVLKVDYTCLWVVFSQFNMVCGSFVIVITYTYPWLGERQWMLCSRMAETYVHIWRSVTGAVRKTHSSNLDQLWPFLAYAPEYKNSQLETSLFSSLMQDIRKSYWIFVFDSLVSLNTSSKPPLFSFFFLRFCVACVYPLFSSWFRLSSCTRWTRAK